MYYFFNNLFSKFFLCSLLLESSGLIFLIFCSTFWERDMTLAFIFLISKLSSLFHWCSFLLLSHRYTILSFENIHYVLKLFLALYIVSVSFGFFFLPPIYLSFMLETFLQYLDNLGYLFLFKSNALKSSMEALFAGVELID